MAMRRKDQSYKISALFFFLFQHSKAKFTTWLKMKMTVCPNICSQYLLKEWKALRARSDCLLKLRLFNNYSIMSEVVNQLDPWRLQCQWSGLPQSLNYRVLNTSSSAMAKTFYNLQPIWLVSVKLIISLRCLLFSKLIRCFEIFCFGQYLSLTFGFFILFNALSQSRFGFILFGLKESLQVVYMYLGQWVETQAAQARY